MHRFGNILTLGLLAGLGLASPVFAGREVCNADIPLEDVTGEYNLTIGTGIVSAMGYTMPYTNTDVIPVTIWENDKDLILEGPHNLHIVFSKVGLDVPGWDFDVLGLASDEDLATVLSCDHVEDMPWTLRNGVGEGSFTSEDGILVDTWMRLRIHTWADDGVSAVGGMYATGVVDGTAVTFNLKIDLDPKS